MTKKLDSTKTANPTKTVNAAFAQALSEMDASDIAIIESKLAAIPVDRVLSRIRSVKGQFFAVDFARKNDKKKNGVVIEPAGTIRHMVCRRGVKKYTDGVLPEGQRKAEDAKNDVLTVWDVQAYQQARNDGKDQEAAGRSAYRRINLADVKAISIPACEAAEIIAIF
jgi:hypothetical protein